MEFTHKKKNETDSDCLKIAIADLYVSTYFPKMLGKSKTWMPNADAIDNPCLQVLAMYPETCQ